MADKRILQHTILDLPEETSGHLFCFLSIAELRVFGGANKKTYKNTRATTFLRVIHSTIHEKPRLNVLKESWKEHRSLVSIIVKLIQAGSLWHDFANHVDTSSFKNFNKSMKWLNGEYIDDEEWVRLIIPNSRLNKCVWTEDELILVNRWILEYDEYYKDIQDNDVLFM